MARRGKMREYSRGKGGYSRKRTKVVAQHVKMANLTEDAEKTLLLNKEEGRTQRVVQANLSDTENTTIHVRPELDDKSRDFSRGR